MQLSAMISRKHRLISPARLGKTSVPANRPARRAAAFTLTELLAILAVLALLLLPVLAQPKSRVTQVSCVNNLRQVGQAIQMFADENSDYLPPGAGKSSGLNVGQDRTYLASSSSVALCYYIATYLGEPAPSSTRHEVKAFSCPAREREIKTAASAAQVVFGLCAPGIADASGTLTNNISFSPFGYPLAQGPRRLADIQAQKPLAQVYSMLDADQWGYPSAAWKSQLPQTPVHGQSRNALYFDGHVAPRKVGPSGTL